MTDTHSDSESDHIDKQQLRKDHPSGFMKLFTHPDMRFVIDALLEQPASEFTKTHLATQTGVSIDTLDKLLPTLQELGVITVTDNTEHYRFQETTPVSKALIQLGGTINAMALEENQAALENLDALPNPQLSYYCNNCGQRGKYIDKVLTGHVLECPNKCTDWTITTDTPPGAAIRLETTLSSDTELNELKQNAQSEGIESLTPHEQALYNCAFNDETPPPMFTDNSNDS